jgi:SAM-dependent methyltransferase
MPGFLKHRLWGDRGRWGLEIDESDRDWQEWLTAYQGFYKANQRSGFGEVVNEAGYKVMSGLDLGGKRVLEIGAGDIRHLKFLKGTPEQYILADISDHMMRLAQESLSKRGIRHETLMIARNEPLPLQDASVDVVVSFYSLEHLYPLSPYLRDIHRVLRPGGLLIGAIPTEGGLAWGLGRYLTSRRWLKKHTKITPDKIICWEHPNFADEILHEMDCTFARVSVKYWPFLWLRLIDPNLIVQFVYRKSEK